jgi:hypothetical protein
MTTPTATIMIPYHALDDLIQRGTRADQPDAAAVVPGTLYGVTDEGDQLERSNGTAWALYSPAPTAVPYVFYYRADTASTALNDPGAGRLRWNAANQQLATILIVDQLTARDFDAVLFYETVGTQDEIVIQDQDVSQNFQRFQVTGPIVKMPDWFQVPVALVSVGGAGTMANNQGIAVIIKMGGATGGGGGGTPDPHHGSHEPGGSDALVHAAWTDVRNVFTKFQTIDPGTAAETGLLVIRDQTGEGGVVAITDLTAPLDRRIFVLRSRGGAVSFQSLTETGAVYAMYVFSNGGLTIRPETGGIPYIQLSHDVTDTDPSYPQLEGTSHTLTLNRMDRTDRVTLLAKGLGDTPLNADQLASGTVPDARLSATALAARVTALESQGVWQAEPFNAANFTADTGTWTVVSTAGHAYSRVGTTLTWAISIDNSTITGLPITLSVTLPGGLHTGAPTGSFIIKPGYVYSGGVQVDFAVQVQTATTVGIHRGGASIAAGFFQAYFTIVLSVT